MRQQGKTIQSAIAFYKAILSAKTGQTMRIFTGDDVIDLKVTRTPKEKLGRKHDFISFDYWEESAFVQKEHPND